MNTNDEHIHTTEVIMKKHITIMVALTAVVIYGGVTGETLKSRVYDCKTEKAMVNLLVALRSENRGLTESAIMRVAEIKMLCPESNIGEVKEVIDSLTVHANVPSIRYKAYLASNVCDNPELFAKTGSIISEDEFFKSVDAQLHETVLGSRTN